ncbi:unnamed protein product [Thlaspi arvense]|uniref:Antitoxin n=1 Tax=Thlaspi arvense TaxID=13288 RepID=A0AAU9RZ15_THLAR|nr:unnamed protein product [Thlaspi arvense]
MFLQIFQEAERRTNINSIAKLTMACEKTKSPLCERRSPLVVIDVCSYIDLKETISQRMHRRKRW